MTMTKRTLAKRLSTTGLAALLGLWAATAAPTPARADAIDAIVEAGVVRIAVPQDLPPFGVRRDDGTLEGYDVEIAGLIAEDLGVRLELVPVTSVNRVAALLTDRADLVVANLGISPERARAIAFSSPYAPFFLGVFGAPKVAVQGPGDLAGRKIAVTRDTLEDRELTALAPQGAEIVRLEDNQATLETFLAGKAELVAAGNVAVASWARQHPEQKVERKLTLRESPAGIGVRRDRPELRHWADVFVLHKKLGGELDRLAQKWLGGPLPPLPAL
jgi:polar amino acid transport system substrate-binding protein